jgi:hypothetical protein
LFSVGAAPGHAVLSALIFIKGLGVMNVNCCSSGYFSFHEADHKYRFIARGKKLLIKKFQILRSFKSTKEHTGHDRSVEEAAAGYVTRADCRGHSL